MQMSVPVGLYEIKAQGFVWEGEPGCEPVDGFCKFFLVESTESLNEVSAVDLHDGECPTAALVFR